jgi:glutaredoxin
MKKTIIYGLWAVGCGLWAVSARAADIDIYYSPTCPHCHHAMEFLDGTLVKEMPGISVEKINVTEEKNLNAFRDALKKCEYTSGGVPVLVVKGKCFQGYAGFMNDEIRAAAANDDAAAPADQKKNNGPTSLYFYGLLIILVGGLGFLLLGKKKK